MLLFAPIGFASAQSLPKLLETNLRNVAGDAWDVWTSPLRSKPRDWLAALGSVAAAAAVSPFDDNVDRWAIRHRNDNAFDVLKPFRSGGEAFSGKTITPVAVGVLALSLATKNETMQEGLFGCVTAYGASSLVRTFVVYPLIARTRPEPRVPNVVAPPARQGDQYDFSVPGTSEWGGHSLPGGHIANVVACTEFLTNRYSMGIIEPAIWAVAGGIGFGRLLDRGHWTSDQVIGVAFGYAVGRQVALRSKRRAERRSSQSSDNSGLFISPQGGAVRLGWSLQY
jgi:membrane-associated phospholipid phosphatase